MTLQQYVDSIREKRIAVLGIGVSNTPLIELLCRNGCDVTDGAWNRWARRASACSHWALG